MLPEPVIRGANRGAAIFSRSHDVDIVETRLANDPLISHAIQRDATGVTKIFATAELAQVLREVKQSVFECRLNRRSERFVLVCPGGPAFVETKPQRHRVFILKFSVCYVEKLACRKRRVPVRRETHNFSRFGGFAKDLLRRR